jgi:hypothetical protein
MISRHHHTKRTVEAKVYCRKCGKPTMHRVADGRVGPCLVCMAKPEVKITVPTEQSGELFKEDA